MRYIPKDNQNIEASIFAPHAAHLRFITDFLTDVEKMKLDIELQKSILGSMSSLLAGDYMGNDDLKNRARELGVVGDEIYDIIIGIVGDQLSFCDHVGSDAFTLKDCYKTLDSLDKMLF
jgi:hypothetical protein